MPLRLRVEPQVERPHTDVLRKEALNLLDRGMIRNALEESAVDAHRRAVELRDERELVRTSFDAVMDRVEPTKLGIALEPLEHRRLADSSRREQQHVVGLEHAP